MKKLLICLFLVLCVMLSACDKLEELYYTISVREPTPTPFAPPAFYHKTGAFRDMDANEFLKEIGPGYSDGGYLYRFDPMKAYDPYDSLPVYLSFSLFNIPPRALMSVYAENVKVFESRQMLALGQSVSISLSLSDLQGPVDGRECVAYTLEAYVCAGRDALLKIQVENARIELPGETIPLSEANGTHFATMQYDEKEASKWVWGNFATRNYEFPETSILRQGTFKADVTLLNAPDVLPSDKIESYAALNVNVPPPTPDWFKYLKDQGFNSVRFQVTWFNHTKDDTYEVDKAWLEKVEEIVNLALQNDLYCSINIAYDMCEDYTGWVWGASEAELAKMPRKSGWLTLSGEKSVEERFAAVWRQIAAHFRDYDERLIFEAMDRPDSQVEADARRENLNALNQIFVDTVRGTGGNNAKRFLLVSPLFGEAGEWMLETFKLPDDPANHTLAGIQYIRWDEKVPEDPFPAIEKYLTSEGAGVVMTAHGSNARNAAYDERVEWTKLTAAKAKALGIPLMWYGADWDSYNGPQFCLINPFELETVFPELVDILVESSSWETASALSVKTEEAFLAAAADPKCDEVFVSDSFSLTKKADLTIDKPVTVCLGAVLTIERGGRVKLNGAFKNDGEVVVKGSLRLAETPLVRAAGQRKERVNPAEMGAFRVDGGELAVLADLRRNADVKRLFNENSPFNCIVSTPGNEAADFIVDEDITILKGHKIILDANTTLTVEKGVTLTNRGVIETYNKPVMNGKLKGKITVLK